MRALFALACALGTTVAALMGALSAQEFGRWQAWMQAEQIGPEWDALRHAELLAAAHNSGQVKRKDGKLFTVADFARHDPWVVAPVLTPEQQLAREQAEYEAFVRHMGA